MQAAGIRVGAGQLLETDPGAPAVIHKRTNVSVGAPAEPTRDGGLSRVNAGTNPRRGAASQPAPQLFSPERGAAAPAAAPPALRSWC